MTCLMLGSTMIIPIQSMFPKLTKKSLQNEKRHRCVGFREANEGIYLQYDDNADDTIVNDDTIDDGLQGFLMNESDDGI